MRRRHLIQSVLLGLVALALVGVVAVFVGYRRITRNPDTLLEVVKKEADMQLNKVRQTAMKNGIREWRLDAESATLLEKKQMVLLTQPEVEFFMQDGDTVFLTADQGTIYMDSNRIDVSGQVSARTRQYRFQTERLSYDPNLRELSTDSAVTLKGQAFTLNAAAMAMDLETNIARFEGGVKGGISERLPF